MARFRQIKFSRAIFLNSRIDFSAKIRYKIITNYRNKKSVAQLHEYQGKKILAAHGIEIPAGDVAQTAAEVREIARKLGKPVVVKVQTHSTSRAAAGGIKFADNAEEAFEKAGEIFAELKPETILVDEKLHIEREFYLGYIVDDRRKRPVLLFSEAGGSGIEERAGTMKEIVCSIRSEPSIDEIKTICGDDAQIARILQKLYRVAKSCEARTAEINPLAQLNNGNLVALDCRISIDDYAVFRHEDLGIEMARELGHKPTKLEKIAWEVERDDFRGTFYFVEILNSGQWSVDSGLNKDKTKNDYLGTAEIQNPKSKIENQQTDHRPPTTDRFYKFKTRTGEIIYDHSVFAETDAAPIVEACPVKILKLDERRLPVLAITREEAERGKCIECLACEFASWEYETGGVKIDLPIVGL